MYVMNVLKINQGNQDPRAVREDHIEQIGSALLQKPTLPERFQTLSGNDCGFDLPNVHCAFRGCVRRQGRGPTTTSSAKSSYRTTTTPPGNMEIRKNRSRTHGHVRRRNHMEMSNCSPSCKSINRPTLPESFSYRVQGGFNCTTHLLCVCSTVSTQ